MNDGHGRHKSSEAEKHGMAEGEKPRISEKQVVADRIE